MRKTAESEIKNRDPDLHGDPALIPAETVKRELARILASSQFRSARSQSEFLRYTVGETLAGRSHLLKEYTIGREAFGRGQDFDPRLDPIVRTQARKIRAKLATYYDAEGRQDPVRIEIRAGSYAPSFRSADEFTAASGASDGDDAHASVAPIPRPPQPGRRRAFIVFTALAVACAAIYPRHSREPENAAPAGVTSIAVLPFANPSQDEEDEFLSDGLTEELIDSLRRVPGLQVVARASAFRFKGKDLSPREIGPKLQVNTVLVGSIRRTGNRMRITVQLIGTANNYHLWSGSYDRDSKEASAVQSEISQAVVNALGIGAARAGDRNLTKILRAGKSPNPTGYRDYLKGLYFWNKLTVDGLNTAIRYFQQTITEDPSFARAYAALADCYVMEPLVASVAPPEVIPKITAAASRALELDDSLGEPHFDLAVAAEYDFDWAGADKEFRAGLALSPGTVVGHIWYGRYLALVDRRDEALVQRRLAAELDPASPYTANSVASYYSRIGRYDDAIEQYRNALALEPNFGVAHQGLGIVYLTQGRYAEAIAEFELAKKSLGGPRRMALLAYAYAVSGRKAQAREILSGFLAEDRRGPFPALPVAQVYIGLGDKDRAFQWLDKAVDQRDIDLSLDWDSIYAPLRSDLRFARLRRRMKLT